MKKAFTILLSSFVIVIILSGNPGKQPNIATGLEPYEKMLFYSRYMPMKQRDQIQYWIKNDQIIHLRMNYVKSMTKNSKP